VNLLLHTIALEPARWTPARVSRPLTELLPDIAAAGFRALEVFEPHLGKETVSPAIRDCFASLGIAPVILSSYLDLNPARTSDALLQKLESILAERITYYGFKKVRLFPGSGMNPHDNAAIARFIERVRSLAYRIYPAQVLLETHDGSLADYPALPAGLMSQLPSNVGLLYQPTVFTRGAEAVHPPSASAKPESGYLICHAAIRRHSVAGDYYRRGGQGGCDD